VIVSWNWLQRYADLEGLSPTEMAKAFTVSTAEIEEVIEGPTAEFLNQFKVAQVKEVSPHPNADKLRCCKVDDGEDELDIVCGAANVREGLLTILAPVGCQLGDFTIKKAKLRGEPSHGMLCSEVELGVGKDNEGIIELEGFEVGQKAGDVFSDLGVQWDLDNKAITHRPDLWGHLGLARELAATQEKEFSLPAFADLGEGKGHDGFQVKIEDPSLCRRYCGLSIKGVSVGPSPKWMRNLLKEVGQSPINNVVDATNFVMLELGQPTHAFDSAVLESREISVEGAAKNEPFSALTGKDIELDEECLVIRSGKKAVALAGVVGGANSSISEATTEVFLEAAHFAPLNVRKTAQRFDLRTDSSARFEKSLDPENAPKAISRIVEILKETCPNLELASSLIDVYPAPIEIRKIPLTPELVIKKMGFFIDHGEQKSALERLSFVVEGEDEGPWEVTVPSWRNTKDVEDPIDLVEEIGRVIGYDRIIPKCPELNLETREVSAWLKRSRELQDHLVARGYHEVKTYSFMSLEELEKWKLSSDGAMALANPLSREQTHMRTSILVRHLEAWALNAKNLESFSLFELGKVFFKGEALLPVESEELLLSHYGAGDQGEGFFRVRNDLMDFLQRQGVEGLKVVATEETPPLAHPVRVAMVMGEGRELGYIAELHPGQHKALGLKHRLSFAVLRDVRSIAEKPKQTFRGIERFPAVSFALSLLVPERTHLGEVMELILNVDEELIQDLKWEGNYQGDSIPTGKVSMTLSMNFRRKDRTMKGDEIQTLQEAIIERAASKNYVLRES
jgi:phenylalanyl-tRNA synthetase beta chain